MSITTQSDKSRIYVNDDLGNAYYVNIQNRYTHDGNGNVSNIKVFSQTFSERDSLVEIGSFNDGNFVLNDTGSEFFSGNIEQFQNESQKISEKPSTIRSLGLTTEKQKNDFVEETGVVNKEQLEAAGFNDEEEKNGEESGGPTDLTKEKDTITRENINSGLQNKQFRERYGNYCYPMTMKENSQDRIKISVIDFRTPTFNEETNVLNTGTRAFAIEAQGERKIRGSATLPIPNGVTDFNAVRFSEGTLNPIQVAAAGLVLGGIRGGFTGAGDQMRSLIEQGVGDGNTGTAVSNFLTSLATGIQPQQLLARTEGAIFNNNLALLFGGPTLRPFTFNFNVSPRDLKESIEVQKIIRMFKQASAVQRTTNGLFLGSPHVFSIEFIDGNLSTHKFLPRIKDCALLNFSTNYMPNNSYMTYENSSMVSYTLQFQFQELEPIFNDNYDDIDDFDEPRISDDGGSIAFFEGDSGGIGF
jgi:hypothetical protein